MNAMDAIAFVAERKIEEAIAAGEFDHLPGMGAPLQLDDLSHMPADMRMAYIILKNSGYLEDRPKQAPANMRELMADMPEEGRVYGKMQRLKVMLARVRREEARLLPQRRKTESADAAVDTPYLDKLLERT